MGEIAWSTLGKFSNSTLPICLSTGLGLGGPHQMRNGQNTEGGSTVGQGSVRLPLHARRRPCGCTEEESVNHGHGEGRGQRDTRVFEGQEAAGEEQGQTCCHQFCRG